MRSGAVQSTTDTRPAMTVLGCKSRSLRAHKIYTLAAAAPDERKIMMERRRETQSAAQVSVEHLHCSHAWESSSGGKCPLQQADICGMSRQATKRLDPTMRTISTHKRLRTVLPTRTHEIGQLLHGTTRPRPARRIGQKTQDKDRRRHRFERR